MPSVRNHHQRRSARPTQKMVNVSSVQQFNSASGLANRAAPQIIGVDATMTPASNPVVRVNIERANS